MSIDPTREFAEKNVKAILEWLALAHGRNEAEDASGLQLQLLTLRNTPVSTAQRIKLLDLLYGHAVQLTMAQLPTLHDVTLPVSRRLRQAVRSMQELLETLAQDYLNSLSELFDPQPEDKPRAPHNTLRRVMHCLAWHLMISHLVAAPVGPGIWQQFHSTFRTSRRLGLADTNAPGDERRIEQTYTSTLLVAIAQPASFSAKELEFISNYIDGCTKAVEILDEAPSGRSGVFWIDPDKDAPPQALSRRLPPPEAKAYYFACDLLAQGAADHLTALEGGSSAADLGLPSLADTQSGHGVLRRLAVLWGNPVKRKFPRRRQSYRADLCAGLDNLWHLLKHPEEPPALSEWIVVNESPDGYALMHVSGATDGLRVGDIVAVRPLEGHDTSDGPWHICVVRWGLTESHEHIEVGLQVLAPRGLPVELALPGRLSGPRKIEAILLPRTPPLRPLQALIVPTGAVHDQAQTLVVLVEKDNMEVKELRATGINEQTSNIEVFTVVPNEKV